MPTYRITSPDGATYEVQAPAGASEQDALAYVQGQHAPTPAAKAPDPTSSFGDNMNAGVGSALTRAGLGIQQAANAVGQGVRSILPQGVRNVLDSANRIVGLPTADQAKASTDSAIAEHAQLDAPLNATVGGKVGNVVGSTLVAVPAAVAPGGQTVGGAAALNAILSAITTPGDLSSRGMAGAAGGAGGALGVVAGRAIGSSLQARLASAEADGANAASQNATRDATIAASRDAGYVIPPASVDQGVIANVLEGVGGKLKTAESAAVKNQSVTNDLVRKTLGLPDGAALDRTVLEGIRNEAGKAYEAVKSSAPMVADDAYTAAIQGVGGKSYQKLAAEFPTRANPEISDLIKDLDRPGFSAESSVELLKQLRFDGFANRALQDPAKKALGSAQIDAAKAIEGVVERNLSARGEQSLLDDFVAARQTIAKTHTVEKALNEGSGNVVAGKLAKDLTKGKPLSGELRQAAQFAQAFPKAAAEVNTSTPQFSPLDYSVAGLGAGMGSPLTIALAALRPGARAAALSALVQKSLVPKYGPGLLGRQVPQIVNTPAARAAILADTVGAANSSEQ